MTNKEDHTQVIVSGATGQVGYFLLPRLVEAGYGVYALSRRDPSIGEAATAAVRWRRMNLDYPENWRKLEIGSASYYIHLAPIWLLPDRIEGLSRLGIRRLLALSSTSRFTKTDSNDLREQETVVKLVESESRLIARCGEHQISWTLFRPTLIYGCGMDKNVTTIARFIKRFGFFPMVGHAQGYRQPVHADDVASACLAALNCPVAFNKAYNLSGGQTLTFRELVEAVFLALDMKPRLVVLPRMLMVLLIKTASRIPAYRHINTEMIERANQDMRFDSSDAQRDFGYLPRAFHLREADFL
jgi:nucleoside-diphosphate-sugar epimerase